MDAKRTQPNAIILHLSEWLIGSNSRTTIIINSSKMFQRKISHFQDAAICKLIRMHSLQIVSAKLLLIVRNLWIGKMIASIHAKIWIEIIPNSAKWQMTDGTVAENAHSRLRQPDWIKRNAFKSTTMNFMLCQSVTTRVCVNENLFLIAPSSVAAMHALTSL